MKSLHNITRACLFVALTALVFPQFFSFAQSNSAKNAQVDTSNAGLSVKVAPGELLPVSVRLANFGGSTRVDVLVTYSIVNAAGKEIYSTSETVAVQTTANFVKNLQIPAATSPGIYTAKTSIMYGGQLVPATTEFHFTIERKFFGLFQSDFFLYGGITLLIAVLTMVLSWVFIKRRGRGRFAPLDYSNIPRGKRTFYEILSDTITQMRLRVGDEALVVASHIDGLKIDTETGRVMEMVGPPSKIIAALVSEYEKTLGKKVSFTLRKD